MARNRCKDHLMETAAALFSRNGYHATGIDTIIEEADVSRMSLYNNFDSKEGLIESVLARQNEMIGGWIESIVKGPGDPESRFDQLFDELGLRWNAQDFHGCPFVNAVAEYSDVDHPVHRAARQHKESLISLLTELMQDMNVPKPEEVANLILLVIDGGTVRAQVFADRQAHEVARAAAHSIVKAARR